jgi:hypothetical protein
LIRAVPHDLKALVISLQERVIFFGFTVVTEIAPIPVGAVSQRHEKFADAGLKPTPFIEKSGTSMMSQLEIYRLQPHSWHKPKYYCR